MFRKNHAIAGAAGLSLALLSGTALAGPAPSNLSYGTSPNFATDSLTSGSVTFPGGVTYTSTVALLVAGSYQVTFTLPAGVTFTTNPTATASGGSGAATAVLSTSGTGASAVTFVVTDTAASAVPITVTLGSFSVTGATALEQPVPAIGSSTNNFLISAQATGAPGGSGINDAKPWTAALAESTPSIAVTEEIFAPNNGNSSTIDVDAPSAGTMFLSGENDTNDGADGLAADLGIVTLSRVVGVVDASDALFTPPATLTGTISGALTNIAAVGLELTGNSCPASSSDATVSAPVSNGSATLSGVPTTTTVSLHLCLYATGTGIIGAGNVNVATAGGGYNFPVQLGRGNTQTFSTAYNGNVYAFNYVVSPTAGYATYVRLVNQSSEDQLALGSITADGGSASVQLQSVTVPANSSLLVPITQFTDGTGVSFDSTDRAAVQLLTGSPVSADPLLVNPDGTVTEVATTSALPPG